MGPTREPSGLPKSFSVRKTRSQPYSSGTYSRTPLAPSPSWRNVERVLKLHALPRLGHLSIGDIRRAEVHRLLDDIVADGRVGTAREARKHLSRAFNCAADGELIPSNLIYALK